MKRMAVTVFMVLVIGLLASMAYADPQTVVYPEPSSLSLEAGQEIDLPIMVSDAADWYGVDVRMAYDPAIVQVVSVTRGVIPQPDFVLWERFDNGLGMAYYVTTQISPTLPVSGSGTIVTIRLRGMANGTSVLNLSAEAARRNGTMIYPTVLDGAVTVYGGQDPIPTATPTPTATPQATPTRRRGGPC